MRKNLFLVAALAAGLSLVACSEDKSEEIVENDKLEMSILDPIVTTYADSVVVPTYEALMEMNGALYDAVAALCANPSDEAFEKAANAWLESREPWEKSEAFLFGPVDALGLDPNMDSWPLDQARIEQILASGDWSALEWTEDSEAEAAQNVRGFHTLEYLLFKDGEARTTSDEDYVKAPEAWCNYMKVVANLLKKDATELYEAWAVSYNGGGAYVDIFKGHNNSTYFTALACIEEIVDGCITIADEVGNAKIGEPYNLDKGGYKNEALYAVESWYSWHSKDDYTNNIYSIRNAYYGSLTTPISSNSIAALVAKQNATLDKKVKDAITAAENAIQSIPTPFRNNIGSPESKAAMEACAGLVAVLKDLKAEIRRYFE
ncbi:MAG: peptidase M75 [Bacteroides sp.]|nr:peptidase M75 [Bacteroides sp.]